MFFLLFSGVFLMILLFFFVRQTGLVFWWFGMFFWVKRGVQRLPWFLVAEKGWDIRPDVVRILCP